MAKDLFKAFQLKKLLYPEHPVSVKTSVRAQNVQVWVKSKEIAKCLHSNNGSGHGILLRHHRLEKLFQGFPPSAAQVGKHLSVIQEISAEHLGYAEKKMAVRNALENLLAKLFAEFHHPFLVTERSEISPLT